MQIKQMNWTAGDNNCQLVETSDDTIELTIDTDTVTFKDRHAVADFIQVWNSFELQNGRSILKNTAPVRSTEPEPVSTDFPKKVRNAIFIMVGLGTTILLIDAVRHMM